MERDDNEIMAYEEESTPSWGGPEITPDYEPEEKHVELDPEELRKATEELRKSTADLREEELPF